MVPINSMELLEFDKLLRLIADYSNSEASKKSVLEIYPLNNKEDIENRLKQVSEIRKTSHDGSPLKLSFFSDISQHIVKIKPEGAVLEAKELSEFIPVLSIACDISEQLKDRFDLPFLKKITNNLTGFPDIFNILKKSIDSEGNILDSASFLLSDLRARVRKLEARIRKKLEDIVRDGKISVFLQDDFITTRSGRWVIPVRMDSKGMVPGVVHDVSKSGETAFIEPLSIINLSNELENLIAEQKAEEIRILRNICSMIRKVINEIEAEFKTILYIDVLNCISRFADFLRMESAQVNSSDIIKLEKARHPLLELSLKKISSGQRIEPLDIHLGNGNTVMVITGANAGGKTVAIKTIGLLIIMALSGMPIPADSSSSIPLVQNLLVDIGDEQSIEKNLSTFSAHISNISEILKNKDTKSVILIDELGTGTDPEEGAAISCAILKELRKRKALVFATTHLSEIKGFVHRTESMINASMEFDLKTLTPLYRLRIGEPGQSHAIEIARRYGMPDNVINEAKGLLGTMKSEFDNLIADLNEKRLQYEKMLNELKQQKAEIEEKNRLLRQRVSELEKRQKEILANAYKEASDIVSETRRQMNALLEEMKKKGKEESRKILKQHESNKVEIEKKRMKYETEDHAIPLIDEIKEGDVVFVIPLGYDASVIDINRKNNRLKILAKNMEIEVPLSEIRFKKDKAIPVKEGTFQVDKEKEETVSSRINLVGLRVDEALSRLEKFLNHAALAELREGIIIHGIGKGLLMKAIHEHLNGHPLVKSFRSGTFEEGGNGITLIMLK
ncbi:MAG: endonuclease MutS2 [Nitrospirae bacterium]|nr:endonuclease MutS2 [Nitrospirota bacterium]